MKYWLCGVFSIGLALAATIFGGGSGGGDSVQAGAAQASDLDAASETFNLLSSGSEATCLVRKGVDRGALVELSIDASCDEVMPGLSSVRFWQEAQDGSVTFSVDGSKAVVTFAAADGVAYESFKPRAPVISLVTLD